MIDAVTVWCDIERLKLSPFVVEYTVEL